jgi:hypothetical protein
MIGGFAMASLDRLDVRILELLSAEPRLGVLETSRPARASRAGRSSRGWIGCRPAA